MIKENVILKKRNDVFVTRICDECGKEDRTRMWTVLRGRLRRKSSIDLCKKCSVSIENRYSVFKERMSKSVNWANGKIIDKGYVRNYIGNGKRVYEHVQIYEEALGRKLEPREMIHHIDFDKGNNNLENLFLCADRSFHNSCHVSAEKCGFSVINKHIWFDWKTRLYSTKYAICETDFINFDLNSVINGRKIGIRTVKRDIGPYKTYCFTASGYNKSVHVEIVEYCLGRRLNHGECVHHVDGNGLNNKPSNLCLLTISQHRKSHVSLGISVSELYKSGMVMFENGLYLMKGEKNDQV